MKKQLLVGSALLAAVGAFSQNGRVKPKIASIGSMGQKIAATFAVEPQGSTGVALKQAMGPIQNPNEAQESNAALPPSTINWKLLCGVSNIYGLLVSQSRPLQYNDNVNAVSFVHRRSATYNPTPSIPAGALSGVITAEISTNWGVSFDSTCLWSDATNWGRYPQGAIYSGVGNTNIANAYIVGSGPTVAGSNFSGDWYASKQLNAFNTTASSTPNAQQFLSFSLASYPANQGPHGWSRMGFSSTDDGVVRSLALIQDDQTGLSTMRGMSVVKGVFNAGVFSWTTDSLIPNTIVESDGSKVIFTNPQMAWNESGTVGYVVALGAAAGATNSNKGYQPIVYKTTNSGTSWTQVPGIDFNAPAMAPLLDHIATLNTNTNVAVPFFQTDFDIVVDGNNKLHIGSLFNTTASSHNDSLAYYGQYTLSVNPGEDYKWGHTPGNRPYLYDFIGDGTGPWTAITVDSMSSEGPSAQTGYPGFNDNPWDATGSGEPLKTDDISARIQMGRTPDGQFITYTWVESDTNFTNGGRKWNNLPNIKARAYSVGSGLVSTNEINVTKVAAGTGTANANVANRATLHYMSPTTGSATVSGLNVDIYTPLTVTNSNPYAQLTNNTTWYQQGKLSYSFAAITGLENNTKNSASNSMIYPNPASNNATLAIDLKENTSVELTVLNTVGQVVKTSKAAGQVGANNINIDLAGLSTGVYMVNVKVGNATSTKKLVVQ